MNEICLLNGGGLGGAGGDQPNKVDEQLAVHAVHVGGFLFAEAQSTEQTEPSGKRDNRINLWLWVNVVSVYHTPSMWQINCMRFLENFYIY